MDNTFGLAVQIADMVLKASAVAFIFRGNYPVAAMLYATGEVLFGSLYIAEQIVEGE